MDVKSNHPLAEIIGRKLSGLGTVPLREQGKMINAAIKAAVKWHEENKNCSECGNQLPGDYVRCGKCAKECQGS